MKRTSIVVLVGCLALVVGACSGEVVYREVDDGGPDEPAAPEEDEEPTPDAGPTGGDGSAAVDAGDAGSEDPRPEPDSGPEPDLPDGGDCVEPCGLCTVGVDACCGYTICQDDWSGESHCMPVVPPHSGLCPTTAPEPGTECPEPGLLCRFDGATRCKCGCDGWNCPYGG